MYLRKGGKCLRKKSAEYLKCRNRFNENLKSIMKEKGYTCRSLSISIEKNEGYISRLLRGKIDPSIKSLFYIASVLDVSFEKLLK